MSTTIHILMISERKKKYLFSRTLVKDDMKLYRHSTQCSYALQWFLDENPEYWVFVPTKITDTEQQHNCFTTNHVPIPPKNFEFTYKQTLAIERFFDKKKYLNSPNLRLDLYHANIITVCKYASYI